MIKEKKATFLALVNFSPISRKIHELVYLTNAKMHSKFSKNAVKMQPKCCQNAVLGVLKFQSC